jgi:ferredoxin--NADP+ reductase
MLCGNPAMLDDMEAVLEKRGIRRHRSKAPGQLVLERYW